MRGHNLALGAQAVMYGRAGIACSLRTPSAQTARRQPHPTSCPGPELRQHREHH
jgi:hypothetical protein